MYNIDVDIDLGREIQRTAKPSAFFNDFLSRRGNSTWFTDGSKLQTEGSWRVGCASYSPEGDVSILRSVDGWASIFTAESVALLDAVEMAAYSSTGDVLVLSDSLSALLTLRSKSFGVNTNPYILKVKEACYLFHKDSGGQSRILFFWITGRLGIKGNERVDELARAASVGEVDRFMALPFADLAQSAGNRTWADTIAHILEVGIDKGVDYVERYLNVKRKPWFHGLPLTRSIIVTVNRCRVNHYSLAASLARKGIVASSECSCGSGEQDLNHVLWQCPLHDDQRLQFTKELARLGTYSPYHYFNLFFDPDVPKCVILKRY